MSNILSGNGDGGLFWEEGGGQKERKTRGAGKVVGTEWKDGANRWGEMGKTVKAF